MLGILLAQLALPTSADESWQSGQRFALIVGVDDYTNEQITDLDCATSDAKLFRDALIKDGAFPDKNIFLLCSDSQGTDAQPSLENIVFRLEWMRDIIGPGDTLVFYFAGHGVILNLDSDHPETLLLAQDADQQSMEQLRRSSLSAKYLNQLLQDTGAQNTLVLLDACRNDPFAGQRERANELSESLARSLVIEPLPPAAGLERNAATIFACQKGERSWEWGDKNHGFFTYYLVEALRFGAYDKSGKATVHDLMDYVRDNVSAAALRVANQKQTPSLLYEGPGPDKWILASSLDKANLSDSEKLASLDHAELVAKVEADELESKRNRAEKAKLESEKKLASAQARVSLLEKKGDSEDLREARERFALAEAELKAASDRLAFTESAQRQAKVKIQAVEATKFGGGAAGTDPEAELARLEALVDKLEGERRETLTKAVTAERQLKTLEKNPVFSERPNHRTKPGDLIQFVSPTGEEAESLQP